MRSGVGQGGGALHEMEWPPPADCQFLCLPSDYLYYITPTPGFLVTKGKESYLDMIRKVRESGGIPGNSGGMAFLVNRF